MAYRYVDDKIDIGASNKPGPGMIARLLCAGGTFSKGELRQKVDDDLATVANPGWEHVLEFSARWAKHYGCGNCGEQSAMAFVYLRQQNVFPLDWYQVDDFKHAFVIIGRDPLSSVRDYRTWGGEAVVCDPWRGIADYVTAESSYFSSRVPNFLYREGGPLHS